MICCIILVSLLDFSPIFNISDIAWCLKAATQPLAECFHIYNVLNMEFKLSEEADALILSAFALDFHDG